MALYDTTFSDHMALDKPILFVENLSVHLTNYRYIFVGMFSRERQWLTEVDSIYLEIRIEE